MIDWRSTAIVSAIALAAAMPAHAQDGGERSAEREEEARPLGGVPGSQVVPGGYIEDGEGRARAEPLHAGEEIPDWRAGQQPQDLESTGEDPAGLQEEGQQEAMTDPRMQPGEQSGETTAMRDMDSASRELYERGFRQGYMRGLAEAHRGVPRELPE